MVAEELRRCACGAFINRVGGCHKCGKVSYEVDPVKRLRRKIENLLRNAEDKIIIKTAEFLGVK